MEHVVSARITQLQIIDPGEIRRVQLTLPQGVMIDGRDYVLQDTMRPGTAFLVKPWGSRTQKFRRRMYTRSNASSQKPGILETFINHTHRPQADTSIWWQSEEPDHWSEIGKTLDIRVTIDERRRVASVYENTTMCKSSNLRLEPDGDWENRHLLCIAFGTGVTPFLSYLQHMAHQQRTNKNVKHCGSIILIASVRHVGQLMLHQELMEMAQQFPRYFRYIPVLTRSWPSSGSFRKGRIIRTNILASGEERIDIAPLLEIVSDLSHSDLRACGSVAACRQLQQGLKEQNITPLSQRLESW